MSTTDADPEPEAEAETDAGAAGAGAEVDPGDGGPGRGGADAAATASSAGDRATPGPDDGVDPDRGAGDPAGAADDRPSPAPVGSVERRDTDHWTGVSALALLAGAVGIVLKSPAVLVVAVVGVAYAAHARAGSAPEVALAVSREFSDADPDPGDAVTVTVTVENVGGAVLPDLRVVDAVPDSLRVVEGPPRTGTALRPGQADAFEYDVEAKRGRHEFDHLVVAARDFSGAEERELELETDDDLVCTPTATATGEVPLRALASRYTGRVEIDEGGEGVEFHATREYRPGDSLSRIDWNRHARTGELATLEFRQERAATVVLLLDLRKDAYLRPDSEGLHAADLGVDAASQVFTALLETGDRVGVAALSENDVWLSPGTGTEHWARARELFATHPDLSPERPDRRVSVRLAVRELRKRLPADAQVVLFSPLCDDEVVRGAKLLDAHGHPVTVLSPDPTAGDTPGRRLAVAERRARMTRLRSTGVRVVDWDPEDPLAGAVDGAARRWST